MSFALLFLCLTLNWLCKSPVYTQEYFEPNVSLFISHTSKQKQNRQNKRAGNPSGVNLAAFFLCSSDLMYLFIKAQIGLILTSRKYFENKIVVVQVQLFLKEANDETEMLALISAIKVILQ